MHGSKGSTMSSTTEIRPFAPKTTKAYGDLPVRSQAAVAKRIAADKASGFSGNELREKYGENLTGPIRRRVLRAHGLDSPKTIARSYATYRNGEDRKGSRHPREHGANAASVPTESAAPAKAARKPRGTAKTRAAKARAAQAKRA